MTPKKAFQQIAAEKGYGPLEKIGDYASRPVIYNGMAVLINILFFDTAVLLNDAKGQRYRIEYCDPNSIELFESLIKC